MRTLSPEERPEKVYGCEVWRDLDWVNDEEKVFMDCGPHPNLMRCLSAVFDSHIVGGKRYDLAAEGRRLANATFSASHACDTYSALNYAMDLTPLMDKILISPSISRAISSGSNKRLYRRYGNFYEAHAMKIIITKNYGELSDKAAEVVLGVVKQNPRAVLGLATGTTPLGLYAKMITDHRENGTDYSKVRTVNLDEYKGLPKTHEQSYAYFMRKNLFDGLGITVGM